MPRNSHATLLPLPNADSFLSFPIESLTEMIYGGVEAVRRRREVLRLIEADPQLNFVVPIELLDRVAQIDRVTQMASTSKNPTVAGREGRGANRHWQHGLQKTGD